jgi:hypothetical protein
MSSDTDKPAWIPAPNRNRDAITSGGVPARRNDVTLDSGVRRNDGSRFRRAVRAAELM